MGLIREPDLYACGIDLFGPANLITWLKNIPPYWKPPQSILDRRIGGLETDESLLTAQSPINNIDRIEAPLLIAAVLNDPRVPAPKAAGCATR